MKFRNRVHVFAAIVAATLVFGASTAESAPLSLRIDRAIHRSGLAAITGVYVYDASTGAAVYTHQPNMPIVPASNEKLITAAAALKRLGPDRTFRTRLALRGTQSGSTFRGNIYLVGGGDPSLATRTFGRRNLGMSTNVDGLWKALNARNIRRITGKLVVVDSYIDRSRFVSSWPVRFRYDQSPALGALTINHATLGSTLAGQKVHNPALHAGSVLRAQLRKHGIRISGRTAQGKLAPDASTIATLTSPSLRHIVRFMNLTSDNFTAEILLRDLGRIARGRGTTKAGTEEASLQLALLGVDASSFDIVDGSGLSYTNTTSARALGTLLRIAQADPVIGSAMYRSLPSSGVSGTLSARMIHQPYKSRVRAKTGTLGISSALTGTATRVNGRRYGFSIVTTSWAGIPTTSSRALQDRIASILVR